MGAAQGYTAYVVGEIVPPSVTCTGLESGVLWELWHRVFHIIEAN